MQSRYYNPDWGRFLNADAIAGNVGELLGSNVFTYCQNNPIKLLDIDGFHPAEWDEEDDSSEEKEAIAAAATLSGVSWGNNVPIGNTGYTIRFDKPHVETDQIHVHIMFNKKEVANQNIDGSPHHPNKNKPGEPPNSVKKLLKKEYGWDWDKNSKEYKNRQDDLKKSEIGNYSMPFFQMPGATPDSFGPIDIPFSDPIPIFGF